MEARNNSRRATARLRRDCPYRRALPLMPLSKHSCPLAFGRGEHRGLGVRAGGSGCSSCAIGVAGPRVYPLRGGAPQGGGEPGWSRRCTPRFALGGLVVLLRLLSGRDLPERVVPGQYRACVPGSRKCRCRSGSRGRRRAVGRQASQTAPPLRRRDRRLIAASRCVASDMRLQGRAIGDWSVGGVVGPRVLRGA